MTVKTKIEEGERWFKKIEQSYPNEQLELRDNVIAFLSAINSIPDHLLEDYNIKFNLAISLNTTSFRREFTSRVKQSNDPALEKFYSWFEAKRKFIEKEDEICKILSQKRHVNTHRFTTGPTINSMKWHFVMPPDNSDYYQISAYPKSSRVFKITSKKPRIIKKTIPLVQESSQLDLYFEELTNVNVKDACKHMLDSMKTLVMESYQKFPIT